MTLDPSQLDYSRSNGLVTVVAQHAATGQVLMVAHADREALERSIDGGEMVYRSRTRGLWRKGETSGNVQRVVSLSADCDADSVLALVLPAGPACHDGRPSCFGETVPGSLARLDTVVRARSAGGEGGYTRRLLADRNLRLKKLGEEAAELAVACADGQRARAVEEAADLVYHALVALRALGAGLDDICEELERRASPGGHPAGRASVGLGLDPGI